MKKMVLILSMMISISMYAQEDEVPAEPGDPAPIGMYIPALLIIGVGLTIYHAVNKNQKIGNKKWIKHEKYSNENV
ncbi:hypothetical protein D1631_13375 [Chryseobacterium nematophagum]|uniref:Signal peptidase n=1 Tax=Chryseobacterium nematophagum TaxID=2305228 RepID=A0A3M7TH07_9FLAO|nr:hypothetical protein [Chryseobacterium nematophagum]RNA62853.1 hypothetical protein D1631_13375 [Chryseobacterium nematophagum]